MTILSDRMPHLSEVMNTKIIPLENVIEAYHVFYEGWPEKIIMAHTAA
jgi:hypothetical protein